MKRVYLYLSAGRGAKHRFTMGTFDDLRVLGLQGPALHTGLCVPETAPDGKRLIDLLRAEDVALAGDI